VTKSDSTGSAATRVGKTKTKDGKGTTSTKNDTKTSAKSAKARVTGGAKSLQEEPPELQPIHVQHESIVPEGLPKKYFLKSTFNTQDIMHAPVEKTIKMLDKILAGERLFTM
jgi:hypothetical protein